jgi:hypothetical protein
MLLPETASRKLSTEEILLNEMKGIVEITSMKTGICGWRSRRWKVGET